MPLLPFCDPEREKRYIEEVEAAGWRLEADGLWHRDDHKEEPYAELSDLLDAEFLDPFPWEEEET